MSNRFLRWTLGGIILGLSVYLAYVVVGHMQTNAPPPSIALPELEEADAGMEGFVYRQTKDGMVQWEVAAQRAEVFEDKQEATLKEVQLRLFGQQGEEMMVDADEGVINTETKDFELRNRQDPIVIELKNGYTILTPHLHWIDANQEIRTPSPVTIQGNGLTITGVGLVGHLESEEFSVLDHVRVQSSS
ncbi:LPS export ABC transporter periplasmic protein LptC [Candidatus Nitronereus thalassa]|uniref:LPS export ABC transporter periplasmic protein LptC n=1 Tax=Candidatus Nitronereus thalassa TaxID=3020898 RepID=A0ABU3KCC8_9BACT|nr:LPS export ABC transporter periplasmic protein LptC [Candidatus Nitronereus thalassa]MDT7043827.1 LPS export ABC transporter periplasmic protein LptC [Candidatus Nitronereus thalassa]